MFALLLEATSRSVGRGKHRTHLSSLRSQPATIVLMAARSLQDKPLVPGCPVPRLRSRWQWAGALANRLHPACCYGRRLAPAACERARRGGRDFLHSPWGKPRREAVLTTALPGSSAACLWPHSRCGASAGGAGRWERIPPPTPCGLGRRGAHKTGQGSAPVAPPQSIITPQLPVKMDIVTSLSP